MAKKIKFSKSILHNVYLLYFLFFVTLLHLGYFIMNQENTLLLSFSLAVLFVYLVNPNMVIVMGISLLFVDLLYLVKKVPEGFEDTDVSGVDLSGVDVSGINQSDSSTSTNDYTTNSSTSSSTESTSEDPLEPFSLNQLITKLNEVGDKSKSNTKSKTKSNIDEPFKDKGGMDERDAVNPIVAAKGVLQENLEGSSIEEVDKQSKNVKSMISTIKESNLDLNESMKAINSIDIHELNKLINTLGEMTKNLTKPEV